MKDYIEVHEWKHAWAGILVRKKSIDRVEHSLEEDNGCKLFLNSGDMIHCVETYDSVREMLEKKDNTARGELKKRGMAVDPEDIAQLEEEE